MLLGLDVGTTAVKALLVDHEKGESHISKRSLDLIFPGEDMVEQNPMGIWTAAVEAIGDVVKRAGTSNVESISVSSQGGTLVPLNQAGRPVGNAIVWMDHRARVQAEELVRKYGIDFTFYKTGWRATGCLPMLSMVWLAEERPTTLRKMAKFAFVGDYVTRMLCGRWATDPTSAGMTMLYNVREGKWDTDLLGIAGVDEEGLPEILPSGAPLGHVTASAASEMGLGDPPLVVNGGHDQYCASLGSGAIEEGDLLISGGTAWVLLMTTGGGVFDASSYLSPGRHLMDGTWGLMTSIPAAGAGLQWLCRNSGSTDLGEMETGADGVSPGSGGLYFMPYFLGSTVPGWDSSMRGAVLGLGLKHSRFHLFRAYMEGVGYEVLSQSRVYAGLGLDTGSVRMIGGAARSPNWPGII